MTLLPTDKRTNETRRCRGECRTIGFTVSERAKRPRSCSRVPPYPFLVPSEPVKQILRSLPLPPHADCLARIGRLAPRRRLRVDKRILLRRGHDRRRAPASVSASGTCDAAPARRSAVQNGRSSQPRVRDKAKRRSYRRVFAPPATVLGCAARPLVPPAVPPVAVRPPVPLGLPPVVPRILAARPAARPAAATRTPGAPVSYLARALAPFTVVLAGLTSRRAVVLPPCTRACRANLVPVVRAGLPRRRPDRLGRPARPLVAGEHLLDEQPCLEEAVPAALTTVPLEPQRRSLEIGLDAEAHGRRLRDKVSRRVGPKEERDGRERDAVAGSRAGGVSLRRSRERPLGGVTRTHGISSLSSTSSSAGMSSSLSDAWPVGVLSRALWRSKSCGETFLACLLGLDSTRRDSYDGAGESTGRRPGLSGTDEWRESRPGLRERDEGRSGPGWEGPARGLSLWRRSSRARALST